MHKADKELSEVAARWEEIKKGTSQVQSKTPLYRRACVHQVAKLVVLCETALLHDQAIWSMVQFLTFTIIGDCNHSSQSCRHLPFLPAFVVLIF